MRTVRWGYASLAVGVLVSFMAAASSFLFGVESARACGSFFGIRAKGTPSLAHEQVLLVHDPAAGRQHFIRKVAFRVATEPFGFVVPAPTRPEVAKVEHDPFENLVKQFAFSIPGGRRGTETGTGKGEGFGSGHGRLGGGVRVLEAKQVGSFTAFVLAATDQAALGNWLKDNHLVSTEEADEWLAHYVRMGFYYVALRYNPPQSGNRPAGARRAPVVKAETVRISFDTPLPYYPYFEPKASKEAIHKKRLLELWLVTPTPVTPIALHEEQGKRSWVRPLRAGQAFENARESLLTALDSELEVLLPNGELVVQTYQDQKVSRAGMGDVLFAPLETRTFTPAEQAKIESLLAILDPELTPKEAR